MIFKSKKILIVIFTLASINLQAGEKEGSRIIQSVAEDRKVSVITTMSASKLIKSQLSIENIAFNSELSDIHIAFVRGENEGYLVQYVQSTLDEYAPELEKLDNKKVTGQVVGKTLSRNIDLGYKLVKDLCGISIDTLPDKVQGEVLFANGDLVTLKKQCKLILVAYELLNVDID